MAHRTTLQKALLTGCQQSGVINFKLGMTVTSIDFDNARLQVLPSQSPESSAQWIRGDLIIAADGVKSPTRACMLARLDINDEGIRHYLSLPHKQSSV